MSDILINRVFPNDITYVILEYMGGSIYDMSIIPIKIGISRILYIWSIIHPELYNSLSVNIILNKIKKHYSRIKIKKLYSLYKKEIDSYLLSKSLIFICIYMHQIETRFNIKQLILNSSLVTKYSNNLDMYLFAMKFKFKLVQKYYHTEI